MLLFLPANARHIRDLPARAGKAGACWGAGAGGRGSGADRVSFSKATCRFPKLQYLNLLRNCMFSQGRVVLGITTELVKELDPVWGTRSRVLLCNWYQETSLTPGYAKIPSTMWPPQVGPHCPDYHQCCQLLSRGSPSLLMGTLGAYTNGDPPGVQHFHQFQVK